ncbi:hypothetical protein CEXT_15461 [Caerostris extrusa]|uniref:Uncharacterized protein n=1 Tax=Caerostris extrusa TaxID=172846 RepID=A0AAV4W9M9_CAEEX|nr:hypothetical protein CEXT_15461 [Caerostris extrusa]
MKSCIAKSDHPTINSDWLSTIVATDLRHFKVPKSGGTISPIYVQLLKVGHLSSNISQSLRKCGSQDLLRIHSTDGRKPVNETGSEKFSRSSEFCNHLEGRGGGTALISYTGADIRRPLSSV